MKIIKPSFELLFPEDFTRIAHKVEVIARTCYKSEHRITAVSSYDMIKSLCARRHWPMLDHASVSVRVICDRGVSHEIVRHRIAAYAQESTRYCNYSKDRFGKQLTFISPCFWPENSPEYTRWVRAMAAAESAYFDLIEQGAAPQEARSVLPNSLKTEIVMTLDLTAWRHFFKLRTAKAAHPQMREIAHPLLAEFKGFIPTVFDDILVDNENS